MGQGWDIVISHVIDDIGVDRIVWAIVAMDINRIGKKDWLILTFGDIGIARIGIEVSDGAADAKGRVSTIADHHRISQFAAWV